MTKVPSENYDTVIRALRRDGWVVVRQRGSHTSPSSNKALNAITHSEIGSDGC